MLFLISETNSREGRADNKVHERLEQQKQDEDGGHEEDEIHTQENEETVEKKMNILGKEEQGRHLKE